MVFALNLSWAPLDHAELFAGEMSVTKGEMQERFFFTNVENLKQPPQKKLSQLLYLYDWAHKFETRIIEPETQTPQIKVYSFPFRKDVLA